MESSMDDERFDALARRLGAASRSRRAALTLLTGGSLGALLGAVGASADAAKRRRGKRGKKARQASGSEPRVIGLACRMAQPKGLVKGEKCGKRLEVAKHHPPHGCCPGSSCMRRIPLIPVEGKKSGWCYCNDGTEPDPEHQGFCRTPPPRPCVGLQTICNALDICCNATEGGDVTCTAIDATKGRSQCATAGGHARCCLAAQAACGNDCDCCGALRCLNGVCAQPPDVCHGLAESCADGEPCCPGAGSCQGDRCCQADGAACGVLCSAEADCAACCAGYCRGDGRCGPVQGCVEYGGFCTTTEECCNNVDCTSGSDGVGRCRYP
jgi:hypothetical protein